MTITISLTYDIVTEESANDCDHADHGFWEPGGWRYSLNDEKVVQDTKENPDLYWKPWKPGVLREAVQSAKDYGVLADEYGRWFMSEPDLDPDGSWVTYHLNVNGATSSTMKRLQRIMMGKNVFLTVEEDIKEKAKWRRRGGTCRASS